MEVVLEQWSFCDFMISYLVIVCVAAATGICLCLLLRNFGWL